MTQDPCKLFTSFFILIISVFQGFQIPDYGFSEILEPLLKFSFLDHDGGLTERMSD